MELSRKQLFTYLGTCGAASLAAGLLLFSIYEVMSNWFWALIIVGGILLLAWVLGNLNHIIASSRKRSTRLGANATVVALAAVAIFGCLNYLGYKQHKKFDLTAEKLFTLSDQTREVVGKLQKDVRVLYFNTRDEPVASVVERYRDLNNRITYERVDLQARPEMAQQFRGMRGTGEVVVMSGSRSEKLQGLDEQTFTSAIIKVTRDKAKMVCFIEGHGERELAGNGPEGYGGINALLKRDNYETKSINLSAQEATLADCAVVVLAGPSKSLFPPEEEALGKFITDGGKALLAVDPDSEAQVNGLLKGWNIELRKDIVIEPTVRIANVSPAFVVVREFGAHAITNKFGAGRMALFPLVQSIKTDTTKSDVTITDLLKTSASSYSKTDVKATAYTPTEGKDNQGPLTLGVAAEKTVGAQNIRLVVLGDSDFAVNDWIQRTNNGDFFVNAINWLAQEADLISIRPKGPTNRSVELTAIPQNIFFWLTVVFLPLAVIVTGIATWWKRR